MSVSSLSINVTLLSGASVWLLLVMVTTVYTSSIQQAAYVDCVSSVVTAHITAATAADPFIINALTALHKLLHTCALLRFMEHALQ